MNENSNQITALADEEGDAALKFDWNEGLSSFPASESDGEVSNSNSPNHFEVFDDHHGQRQREVAVGPINATTMFNSNRASSNISATRSPPHDRSSSFSAMIPTRRRKKPKAFPKRPLSAFSLFYREERTKSALGGINQENLRRALEKKWQRLPASEKQYYEAIAIQDSDRYKREMDDYNNKLRHHEHQIELEELHASQQQQRSKHPRVQQYAPAYSPYEVQGPNTLGPPQCISRPHHHHDSSSSIPPLHPPPPPPPPYSSTYLPFYHSPYPDVNSYPGPPRLAPPLHSRPAVLPRMHPPIHQQVQQPPPAHHHFHPPPEPTRLAYLPTGSSEFAPPTLPTASRPVLEEGEPENGTPIPPGMEIVLRDSSGAPRKYRIQYAIVTMDHDQAQEHMDQLRHNSMGGT
mmetsp:Transcript_8063/g.11644  ORF Transcript_8063/g.11644 Transcript_8063/m.11644 type:complete len:405 (-) Transcript_8063:650-1864(-)